MSEWQNGGRGDGRDCGSDEKAANTTENAGATEAARAKQATGAMSAAAGSNRASAFATRGKLRREPGSEPGLQPDAELHRLLDGLQVCDVPAGLEQRVLRGVQARVAQAELVRSGRWWVRFGRAGIPGLGNWSRHNWAIGAYVTATVAVSIVLVLSLVSRSPHPPLPQQVGMPVGVPDGKALAHGSAAKSGRRDSADAMSSMIAAQADSGAHIEKPVESRAELAAGARAAENAAANRYREGAARSAVARNAVRQESATRNVRGAAEQGATVASTRIGGMPAPPLPLTEQERLLLQVVRARNVAANASVRTALLEMLNQEQQDEELARNDAEFLKFFPPPPPLRDEREEAAAAVKDAKADGNVAGPEEKQAVEQTENSKGKR
jgi:hypothetical protein